MQTLTIEVFVLPQWLEATTFDGTEVRSPWQGVWSCQNASKEELLHVILETHTLAQDIHSRHTHTTHTNSSSLPGTNFLSHKHTTVFILSFTNFVELDFCLTRFPSGLRQHMCVVKILVTSPTNMQCVLNHIEKYLIYIIIAAGFL